MESEVRVLSEKKDEALTNRASGAEDTCMRESISIVLFNDGDGGMEALGIAKPDGGVTRGVIDVPHFLVGN